MSIRGVLFDLDDTLFDHNHATIHAISTIRAEEDAFGVWTPEELRARHSEMLEVMHIEVLAGRMSIDVARRERFRRLLSDATNGPATDERATDLARVYRAAYETAWRAVPGAVTLLSDLRAAGIGVAIVTNNLASEQKMKLHRCGLESLVDALITSEEAGIAKPDAQIFCQALDRLGLEATDAVMVGDAWRTDIEGALAAKIRPIWFNWRAAPSPDASVVELRSLEPAAQAVAIVCGT